MHCNWVLPKKYFGKGFMIRVHKKGRWELYKDFGCSCEQILEAAPHKTAAIQPLISHLTNHPSKMEEPH